MAAITFACGTPHGGAVDSTAALAALASQAGHRARLVVADGDPYVRGRRRHALVARAASLHAPTRDAVWRLHDRWFGRTSPDAVRGFAVERSADVPAATRRQLEHGDLLVVNSMRRLDLERSIAIARRAGARIAWYLRESSSLDHVEACGRQVDHLLANSRPLAAEAVERSGRACSYVPSVISRDGLTPPTARSVFLSVNPVASHGTHVVFELAERLPERQFALQESWPLEPNEWDALKRRSELLPNVELRHRTNRERVFRDAYALLVPHDSTIGGNRPRVALEAQLLGIPVLALDVPGLRSATASAELLARQGATVTDWLAIVDRLDRSYDLLSEEARSFAEEEIPPPDQVWGSFAAACDVPAPG